MACFSVNVDGLRRLSPVIGLELFYKLACDHMNLITESPDKLLAAMVQVLPKDFQITVDQQDVKWCINANPMTTEEWQLQHGLNVLNSPERVTKEET